jgi:hypothetical protein
VPTWGRSVGIGIKCLHADEVYTWGRSVGIGMKCLHGDVASVLE